MKKIILCFLFIYNFSSCSTTLYYVYDEDGSRKGYPEGYCTFEVNTKKGDLFYRGYSEIYADPDLTPFAPGFIFIMGLPTSIDFPVKLEPTRMFTKRLYTSNIENVYEGVNRSLIAPRNSPNTYDYVFYEPSENPDSLVLTQNTGLDFGGFGIIQWFPPYVKKAKKIDYDQFKRKRDLGFDYHTPWRDR